MKAKLIVNGEMEVAIEDGIVAAGRALDNTIPLDYDSNVSRYHIEIETRGEEFWLVELGSSNGTTVNGEKVTDEKQLNDGDIILLGGTSEIIFEFEKEPEKEKVSESAPSVSNVSTPAVSAPAVSAPSVSTPTADAGKSSKLPMMLIVVGVVCGLALVAVVVAVAVSYGGGGKCTAKAKITSPESGDVIKKETEIEVDLQDEDDCASKAFFYVDGSEIASTSDKPFGSSFDPSQIPETPDGIHILTIALQDEKGEKAIQPGGVELPFETLVEATPTPKPVEVPSDKPTPKPQTSGKTASAIETQEMIQSLLTEFKGLPGYKLDSAFSQEVQKRTAEYAADGYFARAQNYNEAIKAGYLQGAALDPPLGYILAMSRTQFKLPGSGAEESVWRVNPAMITASGYNGTCEGETLNDPKQNCAAKASALYMKSILIGVFDRDLVYAVAAFGMSTADATTWKNSLPANRADFWNVIKNPKQREEVVRFFAAGIVAENPTKFGLKKDQPISTLYKNYLVK